MAYQDELHALYDRQTIATPGGHGSFDFADTSVYGPRQLRSGDDQSGRLIVPGSGGGARPTGSKHYGGRGVNATPQGAVIIRLFKP